MSESQQIMITMDKAKEKVEITKALLRLQKNRDFKKIFVDGYLNKHAINLVMRSASPAYLEGKEKLFLDNQLAAIGHFNQYIMLLITEGEQAKAGLENAEEELQLALEEEA